MTPSQLAAAMFAPTQFTRRRQAVCRPGTATDSAPALATGRATAESRAGRRGAPALACLSLFALISLFPAPSAMGALTHPFVSDFTGSDTPQGSLGSEAEKLAVRQSNGHVYVIASSLGVVDIFDAAGTFVSQISGFGGFGGDPDVAVDNSATASEGNLYVLPEFGPLSAYDASGTLLYQLDGSTTPIGDFGDVCGLAVDASGDVYVADFSNGGLIQKFDSSGAFLATIDVPFTPCDIAVDSDGTIWAIQWNNSLHKVAPDGTDLGTIDGDSPTAVNIDPSSHHVYSAHGSLVREFDSSGSLVSQFGGNRLGNSRGVDINGSTGNVYVSTNPSAGSRVAIFGPLAVVTEVTTLGATNITGTSATLNGNVDPANGGDVTECHFEYGTDTSYGNSVPCAPGPPYPGPTAVAADVSGLAQSTTYHFTLVVTTSSAGTLNGGDQTFQTPGPATVVSQSATNVTDSTATLNATVIPNGGDTTCQFQYVDDAAFQASGYDAATSVDCSPFDLGSSFDPQNTSANVIGLTPNTTYHYPLVAANPAGTTTGDDTTFQTLLSFLVPIASFGSPGSGAGQFQTPLGVAIQMPNGAVFVADSGNARVQKFNSKNKFLAAWGWGVANGSAQSQICTSNCQAGIPGSGPGQFSNPTSLPVGNAAGAARGNVFGA